MTVQIDLPAEVPAWAWWTVGVVLWYVFAGAVVRWTWADMEKKGEEDERLPIWLFSPLIGAVLIVVCTVSVILWPLSCGVVQPFWRWGTK